jgi:sugar transferase (PEP-CTERM/EpsH1 system associated)
MPEPVDRKHLLFLAHCVPFPPDKGDRVRAYHQILELSRHFRISLAAFTRSDADEAAAERLRPWCQQIILAPAHRKRGLVRGALSFAAGRSVTEGYFHHGPMRRKLIEQGRIDPFDVAVGYSSGVLELLLAAPARGRVMDLVDVDSAKWRAYARGARWPWRPLYAREADRVARLERRAVDACDAVAVVTADEAELVDPARAHVVGNGVDWEHFQPSPPPAGPPTLAFTGSMDYRPNVEGVCWFARHVWPGLRAERTDLRWRIVGRNPVAAVRQLGALPGVEVVGAVPDIRPYLAEATVAIAPLRIARGVQNKVLEAMAMGRAVVASDEALTGLEVVEGSEVLAATTPAQWREQIEAVLDDPPLRAVLQRNARACVQNRYSWSARLHPLVSLCRRLAAAPADRSVEPAPAAVLTGVG